MLLRRSVAWILDVVAITVLTVAAVFALDALLGSVVEFQVDAMVLDETITVNAGLLAINAIASTGLSAAYVAIPLWRLGGSPGQLLLRLRVADPDHRVPLPLGRALARWFLVFPPYATLAAVAADLPPLPAVIWIGAGLWYVALLVSTARDRDLRGIHDRLMGGTVVPSDA